MIEKEKYIGQSKLHDTPEKPLRFKLGKGVVKADNIAAEAITPEKLSENVKSSWLNPALDDMFNTRIKPLIERLDQQEVSTDLKYKAIADELYSMIASLQVGGIALSQQFGDRTDIGISQKTLTKTAGAILDILGNITHHNYIDFTLTVVPSLAIAEGEVRVTVKADCTDAISDFDSIKIYRNGELVAESSDQSVFITTVPVSGDSTVIKAVGTIMGKPITKQQIVTKLFPFFMGGGSRYQDVLVPECQKQLDGTLEGDYDLTVKNNGDYMFIIIPVSHKDEFRRADMNGLGLKVEIPMQATAYDDYVVYKSLNTYKAGTYNIDIDINS